MRQSVEDQVGDVPIREGVVQVVPVPPPDDQPFLAKNANPLGDGGELLPNHRHDLGHAQFAVLEEVENPQPRGVRHRSEQLGGAFQRGGRKSRARMVVIVGLTGRDRLFHAVSLPHYLMNT